MDVAGLVLAAGAGTRYGGPKALARDDRGTPWLERVVGTLGAAGCSRVFVVLGASADRALPLVPTEATVITAPNWAAGMSASLAAGLESLVVASPTAVLVALVDMPHLPAAVCRRVIGDELDETALRRASYDGRPGHPVLLGRGHWSAFGASLAGDEGGRAYLRAAGVERIECGDLFDGRDIDVAPVPGN